MQHSKLLAGELKSELTVTMCINWLLIADYHALSKCGVSRPQTRILGISVHVQSIPDEVLASVLCQNVDYIRTMTLPL